MRKFKNIKIFKSFFILPILTIFSFCFWNDIMYNVFSPSLNNIIYIWNDVNTVWRTFLQEQQEGSIGIYNGNWGVSQNTKDPLIVRVVKFILKMTIVLSVSMVIYYSVKFLLQVFGGNDLKSIGAKKDLINLIIWLLIALFSVTAIELIISVPKSSLRTSGDIWYNIQYKLWNITKNI